MPLLKPGRTKRLVLDVGTSAIRLCELAPTKSGYQLVRYYQRDLNIDPAMEEEDKAERREEVLQALLKEAKVRSKKTIVAVPGQSVFTRNRPLPPVPEYKVTQIVRYEIQQQIPFSLDQIALDYQVLDRTEAGGYDVMMAAIKVDVVEKQLEVLRKSKKRIDVVDVSPIAAYNWLRHTGEFGEDGQCVALLDLGATTTDIVIQKDNQFRFTRSLHVGGNDITSAVASSFNMSYEDAERLKREKGFAPTGDTKRDGRGGEVIGRVLNRLVGEANRSFAYFRSQPGGGPVTRVIITGGGACLRNIIPYLQRQLGIEVRIAQPLAGIVISPKANEASEHPEQACVALGLALRCCQPVPIQINLIPPRVLEVARRKEQAFYWILSLATMYLILASIIPVTAAKDEQVQQRIKQLKAVLAQYDAALIDDPGMRSPYEDDFDTVQGDIRKYQEDVSALDDLREHRNFWLPYLQAINDARPPGGGVAISSLETIVIGGAANTGKALRKAAGGTKDGEEEEEEKKVEPEKPAATGFAALVSLGASSGAGARNTVSGKGGVSGFPGLGPGQVLEPNGFSIYGYAKDIDAVKQFVESLKEQDRFIKGGVDWDVAFSDNVPDTELDAAKTGGGGVTRDSSSQDTGSSGGGFQNLAGLVGNAGTRPQASGRGTTSWGEEVTTFHIDLQFQGKPKAKKKKAE